MSESCSECQNQQGRDNQIISSDEICEIILIVFRWKQFTWSLSSNLSLTFPWKHYPALFIMPSCKPIIILRMFNGSNERAISSEKLLIKLQPRLAWPCQHFLRLILINPSFLLQVATFSCPPPPSTEIITRGCWTGTFLARRRVKITTMTMSVFMINITLDCEIKKLNKKSPWNDEGLDNKYCFYYKMKSF